MRLLKPEGRIIQYLGDRLLDEITPDVLEQYWIEEVLGKNRKEATGTQDIAAIAAVFKLARKKKFTTENPCGVFVGELHEDSTKADRAERVPGKDIRPTSGEDTKALLVASEEESLDDLVYTLLLLDGGLRSGEALGLRWGYISFGSERDRNSRKLSVEQSRPRGGAPENPKSGRGRRVGLSLRLRSALLRYQRDKWNPSPDAHVLEDRSQGTRWRQWQRITKRAGLGAGVVRPKDLRDTFACVLLSSGVPVAYVSKQLGHSSISTTLKHYAKWCHGDDYVDPIRLSPSQLPADLICVHSDQRADQDRLWFAGSVR